MLLESKHYDKKDDFQKMADRIVDEQMIVPVREQYVRSAHQNVSYAWATF